MAEASNPDAPAERSRKYALPERERRFLLREVPPGEVVRTRRLTDDYVRGTRLRVRRSVETAAGVEETFYKLTQKVPAPDGTPGLITNFYLSAAEYELLATLPAQRLEKTRYSVPPFGIDVFEPPLDGLFIAEIEFDGEEASRAFPPPAFAVAEVTHDLRFTGGRLITTTREQLRAALASYGVHLSV